MKINNTSVTIKNVGQRVTLYGWVNKKRDLGGLVFIDLRDRSGIIQLVVNPTSSIYNAASSLKNEYVIKVEGVVSKRKTPNDKLITGEIEVVIDKLDILLNKMNIIIENTKKTRTYNFDISMIENFIDNAVIKIKEELKKY